MDYKTSASHGLSKAGTDEKKKIAKKGAKEGSVVVFVSRDPEPYRFDVNGIRSHWDDGRFRLVWEVPADIAEGFRRHPHVMGGRIVEAK